MVLKQWMYRGMQGQTDMGKITSVPSFHGQNGHKKFGPHTG